jgi:beta-N-acetylhexosaminidase
MLDGLTGQGVQGCLKHFPGHGSSTADSHLGVVDVSSTWTDVELEPYRALIPTGAVNAVLVAHVFNRNLDPQFPASLSAATIDRLRSEIGFTGVVVSDDMQMGAITAQFGFDEAIRLALNAGNDLLTFGNNLSFDPALGTKAHDTILRLVDRGDVDKERVLEANERVQKLKALLA